MHITPEILSDYGFYQLNHLGLKQPTLQLTDYIGIHFNFDGTTPLCVLVTEMDNDDYNISVGRFVVETTLVHIQTTEQLESLIGALGFKLFTK